jgi:type IV secretory pathway TrbF-like protein
MHKTRPWRILGRKPLEKQPFIRLRKRWKNQIGSFGNRL